jgi:hypothetical protein
VTGRPSVASEAVGSLRVDIGRHPGDARANQLVGELAVHSEHFRQWWAGRRVATGSAGSVRLHHPVVGELELHFETWRCRTIQIRCCACIPRSPARRRPIPSHCWAVSAPDRRPPRNLRGQQKTRRRPASPRSPDAGPAVAG